MVASKGKGKKSAVSKKVENPLFAANPKNFRIGGDIRHKKDLSRLISTTSI